MLGSFPRVGFAFGRLGLSRGSASPSFGIAVLCTTLDPWLRFFCSVSRICFVGYLGIWVLGLLGCLGYAGPRYNPRPRTLGRSVVSVLQHLACGRRWCSLTVGATAALRVEVSSSLSVSSDCRADAIYTVVAAAVAAVAAAR